MAAKRVLHQDPEYEAIPAELQEKRIKLMEDSVRKQTKKKIESIINANFDQEKNSKEAEIDSVDETLYECRSTLDRLRACAVTHYYANLGQEQTLPENTLPSIHPTVKKYLGKSPKYMNPESLNQNCNDTTRETVTESSSVSSSKISNNNQSQSTAGIGKQVPSQIPFLSPSKDISSRAPRFKTKSKIVIGNISKFIPLWQRDESDQSTHKWMIYVRGDMSNPKIDHFVQKVRFLLHPSYRPTDIVEICNPPFHLDKRGWGEFPVRVQLYFHDPRNKPVDIIHNLKLDKTFTGLPTLGAETVVELQLFKAEGISNSSSGLSTPSSISTFPSTLNFHESSAESSSSSNPVSIKMEIDIDSEASVDASNLNSTLPSISTTNCTKSETIPNENSSVAIANVLAPNENSSTTGLDIENNRTVEHNRVVPNTNNSGLVIKPPLKNNMVLNGVNTKLIKCTDKTGNVLFVPPSSVVCIKPQKVIKKTPTIISTNNSLIISSEKDKVVNAKKPLPSYILKVLPLCSPTSEKKIMCTVNNVPAETDVNKTGKPNSFDGDKNHVTSLAHVNLTKPVSDSWQQEILNIKLEYYKSFVELLTRVCKVFQLVKEGVDRSIYPFCASSLEEFLRWNVGKQRASEWRRAGLVRKTVKSLLRKNKLSNMTEESVWPRHKIMSWCRKNGFVPMTSEKMTLLPEPKWSGVELCSVSNADDLISTLKEESHPNSHLNTEDEEIEILEEIDVKPSKSKSNPNQQQFCHLPPLNEASVFVKEVAKQIGIDIKPVELEPSIQGPVVEDMILAACRELATSLLRASVNAGYNRLGGQLCPEEITVSDVYSAIKETPQFDFLNNSYLGIPKEARGDT